MRTWLALLAFPFCIDAASAAQTDLVLRGKLDGRDNQTYREVPFDVPAGTRRITVEFSHSGQAEKTTIDLGLLGPGGFRSDDGFRGWSGGNKRTFTVGVADATPSYLPGRIEPGRWHLLLGIPNIRKDAHADYVAKIRLSRDDGDAAPPLRSGDAWYRGDLHMHSGQSDGSCASQSGARVPCPLFVTATEASRQKLDFVAITEHNTISQAAGLRELQPYFDRLLLMPGREITTFQGHANLFGSFTPLDFRIGSASVPDWNTLLDRIAPLGALVSINHPIRPSGEICMGCGWMPRPDIDYGNVQAVEVVNGMDADTPLSGIPFWHALLDRGHRLTAIGGSDNHDAGQTSAGVGSGRIGRPTTVVHAAALSTPAILAGIRAGHVFVDVAGSADRQLEFGARIGDMQADMGDAIEAAAASTLRFTMQVKHLAGGRVELIEDGKPSTRLADPQLHQAEQALAFDWPSDGHAHWLRVDVRDADGRLALIGNPIYVNHAGSAASNAASKPNR